MADSKIYLPAQRTRRGVSGYVGKDVVIIGSKGDQRTVGEKSEAIVGAPKAATARAKAAPKAKAK